MDAGEYQQRRKLGFRPAVFLSSCFRDQSGRRLSVRDRLIRRYDAVKGDNPALWVAERFDYLSPETRSSSALQKAVFCCDGVADTDCFVALLADRGGSKIDVFDRRSEVTFFEIELFAAALYEKPAYVYEMGGYKADKHLQEVLTLFRSVLPERRHLTSEAAIIRSISSDVWRARARRLLRSPRNSVISSLVSTLLVARHRAYRPDIDFPMIRFLGDHVERDDLVIDTEMARECLRAAAAEPNYRHRFPILWLGYRAMAGAPAAGDRDEIVRLRDEFFAIWNSTAAWYGLHGHVHMGCVAALSEVSRLRRMHTDLGEAPNGGLASAYYSIAKKLEIPAERAAMLKLASNHIDLAMAGNPTANNLLMRGSIGLQLGSAAQSLEDYRAAVDQSSDLEARGIAESELGFAVLQTGGSITEAIRLLERGVLALDGTCDQGFLVRAKRKLGYGYLKSRSYRAALRQLAEAAEIARRHNMLDQISKVERIASRLALLASSKRTVERQLR